MSRRELALDIETYSSVDLKGCGVHKYAEAPDFQVLIVAYAWDDEPVQVVDVARGEALPPDVAAALTDPLVRKTAFNAAFERTCLAKFYGLELPPEQWRCTAVHARMMGLPGNLDGVAKALRLSVQKDPRGEALIRYFSKPCKPTKANGGRTRNLPEHAPEKWEAFKSYCSTDVEVERRIRQKLSRFKWPGMEQLLWVLDQRINDRGVLVDMQLVRQAIQANMTLQERLEAEAVQLTGLDNPNSVSQLKEWLQEAEGIEVDKLNKETVPALLKTASSDTVRRVLEIRQQLSKASVKKYQAIERSVCQDGRVRGLLQFHGAGRTGRWAGRLVQVQNLPRNDMPDLDVARELLRSNGLDALEMLYDNVPDVLSQLIRTAFIPAPGHRLIVADFSAIEARVVAWLAGEQWRLDVFNTHGKIYEASAAQMFKVPLESITKGSPLRQKGKIAELALGYGGGVGALKQMGALKMGLSEDELPELVQAWREANPAIVQFWHDMEQAAKKAVSQKTAVQLQHGIEFSYEAGALFMRLPSGRRLCYIRPRLEADPQTGKVQLTYDGAEQGRWTRIRTYGGKLVENVTQAVARDCLAVALLRLDEAGYDIVMHVHDEIVAEVPVGASSPEEVAAIMGQPIEWAPGLPLTADAYECDYYRKD